MKEFRWPVAWRYLAIMVQFVIVLLVARALPIADAGTYFSLFGLVAVASVLGGAGIPDGLVRLLPRWKLEGGPKAGTVANALALASVSSVIVIAIGSIAAVALGSDLAMTFSVAIWLSGYVLVFILAQLNIAQGKGSSGAFLQYSLINFCYLVTLVPYLLLPIATLQGVLWMAACGSVLAATVACIASARTFRSIEYRPKSAGGVLLASLRAGAPMVIARLLQASLPWTPVWILAASGRPADAALYAAASRLVVVVTSVLASIRFSVRPRLVEMLIEGSAGAVARLSQRVSIFTSALPALASILLVAIGDRVLTVVLGAEYRGVAIVLTALMIGVLAESVGGLSDEVLKMMGLGWVVVSTLIVAVLVQVLLGIIVASRGALAMAFATALAFSVQYSLQLGWLALRTPVRIWSLSSRSGSRPEAA